MKETTKMTKTELLDYIEDNKNKAKIYIESLTTELHNIKAEEAERENKVRTLTGKNLYLTDLVDLLSDTSGLNGKNETEINAKLIKSLRVIKYAIKKG